jgi:asparagine synthase (glutamine-hydrolysing)
MCGIVGIVARGAHVPADVLERATASLAHRGPDDSGTMTIRDASGEGVEVGLGHRRLAIIDLSPLGHQPMQDPQTGNWIVYNGEVYNFRAVREQLERLGDRFVSQSDTEVILRAYAHWGERCLEKFRGMFAFAIWDAQRHSLWIARDPMGVKPLYYAQTDQYFVFASEVRTILGTGLVAKRLNPSGLLNYLNFGSAYDPLTLAEGIFALPAGHWLKWENGSVKVSRYWDLVNDRGAEDEVSSKPVLSSAALRELLEESVRLQLVSDVPVGVFLSGGIDSSALVSILSRGGVTPATFSIVFREAEFNEQRFSRAVASRFCTDHHETTVSQRDVLDAVPDALRAMDQPSMDAVNTYFVSRETRAAGLKVALSGLGGDEVFAGYATFRMVPRMERAAGIVRHFPNFLRQAGAGALRGLLAEKDSSRKLAALAGDDRVLHPYFLARWLFTPQQCAELFPAAAQYAGEANAANAALLARTMPLDPINRVSYLEARGYMLNTLLRDSDFMSMAHGLEVRVPLLDHWLAKAVMAIPGKKKLGKTPKQLLVGALGGSLPDEVVHRPKQGFQLPFEQWLREDMRETVQPALSQIAGGPLGSVLDRAAVENIWTDFMNGRTSYTRPWALYVLQEWCKRNL